jgi:hypothetical protein
VPTKESEQEAKKRRRKKSLKIDAMKENKEKKGFLEQEKKNQGGETFKKLKKFL